MDIERVPIHRSNYSVKKTNKMGVVMHWMAGRMAGATARFKIPRVGASAHYGIADNKVVQWVIDEETAYHAGSISANSKYIGIEHEGGWLLSNGQREKPSDTTHKTSAQLLAQLSRKYKWGTLELGRNVFAHKSFKATQCPGTLDLQYIINEANKLINPPMSNPEVKYTGNDFITRICENYEILLVYPDLFLSHKFGFLDGEFGWNDKNIRAEVKWWAENRTKEQFKQAIEEQFQTWKKNQK
jgi:N-acetylmuramoyl-L-alanine amidase CwlA